MITVPISSLSVGTISVFTFKDPYSDYVKALLKTNSDKFRLEITTIMDMRDHIKLNLRDPMTDIYNVVGLGETDYKRDLNDNVKVITFRHLGENGMERRFRVPLTYIEDVADPSSVAYVNKGIFIGLDMLPLDLDLTYLFNDIEDMISGRLGVDAKATEVVTDDPVLVPAHEYEERETIRRNTIKVRKSNEVRVRELNEELYDIHKRLKELKITLGD